MPGSGEFPRKYLRSLSSANNKQIREDDRNALALTLENHHFPRWPNLMDRLSRALFYVLLSFFFYSSLKQGFQAHVLDYVNTIRNLHASARTQFKHVSGKCEDPFVTNYKRASRIGGKFARVNHFRSCYVQIRLARGREDKSASKVIRKIVAAKLLPSYRAIIWIF